jgi:hypothetical protein
VRAEANPVIGRNAMPAAVRDVVLER